MSKHYLLEQNIACAKMMEQMETSQCPATPSKYAGFGAAELMIGFFFGIGVILAIGVVDGLNYCAGALTSNISK